MPVYLIRAGANGPVKIGYALDPRGRLTELQVAHYEPLSILRMWEGGEPEEAMLHLRFADLCIRGEWFSFSRQMLGDVGLTDIPLLLPNPGWLPAPKAETGTPRETINRDAGLDRLFQTRGAVKRVANGLGISTAAVSQWKQVPRDRVEQVAAILQVEPHILRPDLYGQQSAA